VVLLDNTWFSSFVFARVARYILSEPAAVRSTITFVYGPRSEECSQDICLAYRLAPLPPLWSLATSNQDIATRRGSTARDCVQAAGAQYSFGVLYMDIDYQQKK